MKICCDIDGVVRDLNIYIKDKIGRDATNWEEGKVLFDIMKECPLKLFEAPPTKYYETIKYFNKMNPFQFVSTQPLQWRPYTECWMKKYFPQNEPIFVKTAEEKLDYYKKAELILEDYPYYSDYSRIVLMSYKYNINVKNPLIRVRTQAELWSFLCSQFHLFEKGIFDNES